MVETLLVCALELELEEGCVDEDETEDEWELEGDVSSFCSPAAGVIGETRGEDVVAVSLSLPPPPILQLMRRPAMDML